MFLLDKSFAFIVIVFYLFPQYLHWHFSVLLDCKDYFMLCSLFDFLFKFYKNQNET